MVVEIGGVNVLVAFLAGIVSCISPCVLPLAPVYAASVAGGSAAAAGSDRRAPLIHALAFMSGFILLFVVLGVSIGLVGYVLRDQLPLLQKVGGIVVIVMGLHMSRIIEIPALYRGLGIDWDRRVRSGYLRSFLAGSFISAGWLPCIGPTLGAILSLAVASGTVLEGGVLLMVYSLGLVVPFVLLGATLSRTPGLLRWMNRHHHTTTFIAGIVMIAAGILLFTGTMQRLNAYFNFANAGPAARL